MEDVKIFADKRKESKERQTWKDSKRRGYT